MTIQRTVGKTKPFVGAFCLTVLLFLSKLVCAYHLAEHADLTISEESACELCLYSNHSAAIANTTPEFTPPEKLSGSCLYENYCFDKNPSELAAIRAPPAPIL
jgi:hypothetical protein